MRRLSALGLLLIAPALCALVLGSDPDSKALNTRAPASDPGWANVGTRSETTAIYLGNGWVITAAHVGAGDAVFGGVSYRALPASAIQLGADTKPPRPDLIVFRVEPRPKLPSLRIRPTPPGVGDAVVLVGAGRERGEPITWNGLTGWAWSPQGALRWGTNRVFSTGIEVGVGSVRTPAFAMRFDAGETPYEAQAALGDSGGAVFIRRAGRFELAGVMIAVATYSDQPIATSFFGNLTTAADLSVFRGALTALQRGD